MSLSRAFTTRRLRAGNDSNDSPKMPQRSKTTKGADSIRNKISGPVQLIHTTNMLSYNAPDIQRPSRSNSTSTSHSGSESGFHTASESSPPTSPDVGSDERTPSPEPNHLSCYFKSSMPSTPATEDSTEAPVIPKRSPSHTKKNSYDAIARQRSVSNMSRDSDRSMSIKLGQTFSRPPSTSTRASSASHASSPTSTKQTTTSPPPPPPQASALTLSTKDSHPFGHELAQVTELAEEYNTTGSPLETIDEEQQYLDTRGLKKWSADDYLSAIHGLSASFFPDRNHVAQTAPLWI